MGEISTVEWKRNVLLNKEEDVNVKQFYISHSLKIIRKEWF